MATKIWVGTDTGNEGDWSVAANWSPSGVPVTADSVILNSTSTESVTGGLNQSAVDLEDLIVTSGYTGSIGTSAAYLQISVSNSASSSLTYSGIGSECWIDAGGATGIDNVLITTSAKGADTIHLTGKLPSIIIQTGVLTIDTGAVVTSLIPSLVSNESADVTVTIATGATLATLSQLGGEVTSNVNITTATISGGSLITTGTATVGTVTLWAGTHDHRSTGTITSLTIAPKGKFTGASAVGGFTISGVVALYSGGACNIANNESNILVAAGVQKFGGALTIDPGRIIIPQ